MEENQNIEVTPIENKNINKKGNKGLIVILIVIIVLLTALCVYLAFFNDKNETTSSKKDNKESVQTGDNKDEGEDEDRDLTEDEIVTIMKTVEKYYLFDTANFNKKIVFSNGKLTDEMIESLVDYYFENYSNAIDDNWYISKDVADKYFTDAFGYIPKEYIDGICKADNEVLYIYDKENERYIYNEDHPGHGGMGTGFYDYLVQSAIKKNDKYVLDIVFLYNGGDCSYMVNNESYELRVEYDEDGCGAPKDLMIKQFREDKDKFMNSSSFELVFVKKNGKYIIQSIEFKK